MPSIHPSSEPSLKPSSIPSLSPSSYPSLVPSTIPTINPTKAPTGSPTASPTKAPTKAPTTSPTKAPTGSPTASPTESPTKAPTTSPTKAPTGSPTASPTESPTKAPTTSPTKAPTGSPTASPTESPTKAPTTSPTKAPTGSPTASPTEAPSLVSSSFPSIYPSMFPSKNPTNVPTFGDALVACSSNKCAIAEVAEGRATTEIVPVGSSHGVRCCTDSPLTGFVQAGGKCPNLWVTSRDANGRCVRGTTYFAGLAICEGLGARLCTVQENFNNCSKPAKCRLNNDKVWAAYGDDFPSTHPSQQPSQQPSLSLRPSIIKAVASCSSTKCVNAIVPPDIVTEIVPVDSSYGIRCCADSNLQGFLQAGVKCPGLWVTSRDNRGVCARTKTYSEGKAICEEHGARLCTVQENLDNCTKPAKCSLNIKKVWTSTLLSEV